MFRRRATLRSFRRHPMGEVPPALQRANQLYHDGDYYGAALIFEDFSRRALARNGPRASWFLLQAGRMRIQAGEVQVGMEHVTQALHLFVERGQWDRLSKSGNRLLGELNQQGLFEQASQIEKIMKASLPVGFVASSGMDNETVSRILPSNCPKCGAPLHKDEVEWMDKITAECPYCGNAVRSE
jgi:endogenous inhibitor of DNA gyrase (YacG/DUF329 family)